MEKTIATDTPLSELTLRRYEKPNLKGRDLVRKLCLSIGLLQPGDSRDVVVDILYIMLKEKKELNSEEIRQKVIDFRKQKNLAVLGVASSNVRRQLKRLRDVFLVEKTVNNYRITEFSKLSEIFNDKLEKYLLSSIIYRIKEYIYRVDESYK